MRITWVWPMVISRSFQRGWYGVPLDGGAWLQGAQRIGVTAGASAPEVLVQEVLAAMNERFAVTTENITTAVEEVVFKLPRSLTA